MTTLLRVLTASVVAGCCWSVAGVSAQQPPAPPAPAAAQPTAPAYVVQAGDELSIKVFSHAEVDDTVTVRPDGRISAALVDDVPAAGLTVEALD